jgi:hypothetical protein
MAGGGGVPPEEEDEEDELELELPLPPPPPQAASARLQMKPSVRIVQVIFMPGKVPDLRNRSNVQKASLRYQLAGGRLVWAPRKSRLPTLTPLWRRMA